MVLNCYQLRNYTSFTFQLINSENARDNYTVGPWDTTMRGDMWLTQGDGRKGVTILASCDGAPIRPLLHMWDNDWALRYRIGGQTVVQAIAVNGNKDFSIDVRDTGLTFVCFNGSFTSGYSQVEVSEWKDQITNSFSKSASDPSTVEYALDYVRSELHLELRSFAPAQGSELVKAQVSGVREPTARERQAITDLIATWVDDYLEHGRRQGTLYADGNGWRIDLQDNGSVERRGMHFYNIAVQYGSGSNNVYAHVMLPVGYVIGRRRIRNALLESMRTSQVANIIPPDNSASSSTPLQHDLLSRVPYQTDEARTSWAIRSLAWLCVVGSAVLS